MFSLVIVRVALGVSSDTTTGPTKLSMFSAAPNNAKMTWQSTTDNGYALRPVAVNVSRATHTNTTYNEDVGKESVMNISQDDSPYDRAHKPPQGQHFNVSRLPSDRCDTRLTHLPVQSDGCINGNPESILVYAISHYAWISI